MRMIPAGVVVEGALGAGSTFSVVAASYRGQAVVLRRTRGDDEACREAWRRHRATLATVQDPAIPSLVAEGNDLEGAWLLEARARGVPLSSLLEARGPLPPAMVAGLARALFSTLARLQGLADDGGPLGFVHGDIGPDHIFIGPARRGEAGALTLVDFGLATVRGLGALAPGAHGTLPYCPPERARGEEAATGAGDVYAAAAVLAHAALGRPPARSRGPALLVEVAERGLDLEGLDAALRPCGSLATTLRHLLAFEPDARIDLAAALAAASP